MRAQTSPSRAITNRAEASFAAEMDAAGKTWFHQPKTFALPAPLRSYRPDFYVIEDQAFYEILGTRQAYSYARTRIEAFSQVYPHLKLITVNAGAWVDGPDANDTKRVKEPKRGSGGHSRRNDARAYRRFADVDLSRFHPEYAELITRARQRGYRTYAELAIALQMGTPVLYAKLWQFKPDPILLAQLRALPA